MPKLARTNFRRTGNLIAYGETDATTTSCGLHDVATGLRSPRFAIAMPRCTVANNARDMRGLIIYYHTTTDSIVWFQLASMSNLALLSQSYLAFNWVAFE